MLGGGSLAGAKVESIVRVDTVSDCGDLAFSGEGIEHRKKLILAVVAAARIVHAVSWIFQFARLNELVTGACGAEEAFHLFPVECGIAGGNRGYGECVFTKRLMSGPGQICGVNSPGEGHD